MLLFHSVTTQRHLWLTEENSDERQQVVDRIQLDFDLVRCGMRNRFSRDISHLIKRIPQKRNKNSLPPSSDTYSRGRRIKRDIVSPGGRKKDGIFHRETKERLSPSPLHRNIRSNKWPGDTSVTEAMEGSPISQKNQKTKQKRRCHFSYVHVQKENGSSFSSPQGKCHSAHKVQSGMSHGITHVRTVRAVVFWRTVMPRISRYIDSAAPFFIF
ncbi:hypothetical protein TNCV_2649411 [Trichonephila clavipes]|nr:hypothetical protein TNCV_2649411 [Trichonephila clavipes]